jgi:hypothetical protein
MYLDNTAVTGYVQYAYRYTTAASTTQLKVSFGLRQDPSYWVLDDVYIVDTVTGLTVNNDPSFETGSLAACCSQCNTFNSPYGGQVISYYPHTGNYDYEDGAVTNPDYVTMTMNIVANRAYNITFWLQSFGGTPNCALLIVGS